VHDGIKFIFNILSISVYGKILNGKLIIIIWIYETFVIVGNILLSVLPLMSVNSSQSMEKLMNNSTRNYGVVSTAKMFISELVMAFEKNL